MLVMCLLRYGERGVVKDKGSFRWIWVAGRRTDATDINRRFGLLVAWRAYIATEVILVEMS